MAICFLLSNFTTSLRAFADDGLLIPEAPGISEDRKPLHLALNMTKFGDNSSELALTLYQKDMKTKVPQVVYAVTLSDTSANATVMKETFFAKDGTATIKLVRSDKDNTAGFTGVQEQYLNAWVADGSLTFYSSLLRGRVYDVTVHILGIDNVTALFSEKDVPRLEFLVDMDESSVAVQSEVVPEFPQFALLLPAASILSVFVILSRMRMKF